MKIQLGKNQLVVAILLGAISGYVLMRIIAMSSIRTSKLETKSAPTAQELYDAGASAVIHGLVLDAEGMPIPNASVVLTVRTLDFLIDRPQSSYDRAIESGPDGLFSLRIEKPIAAFVKSVAKTGYVFEPTEKSRWNLLSMKTSPGQRLHLQMRKLGTPVFLLSVPRSDAIGMKILEVDAGRSATNKWNVFQVQSFKEYWPNQNDLEVAARYDESTQDWELTYRTLAPGGGLYLSTRELFTAPTNEYAADVRFRTAGAPEHKRYYIYLRRKSPELFIKIEISQTAWAPKSQPQRRLTIDARAWTNPYGERNFEPMQPTQENWLLFKEHTRYCLQCINEGRRADPKHLADLLNHPKEPAP
ncbi:MAG: carboxypeptidase-like regulatory domain-containing protein [Kiritimatiellia bacterium]